jgi:hypothetical protein
MPDADVRACGSRDRGTSESAGLLDRDVRQALDGWLAHLGSIRLGAEDKPNWDHVLAGCRTIFVEFVDRFEVPWRERFLPARNAALGPG